MRDIQERVRPRHRVYWIATMVVEPVRMFLSGVVVRWFSRKREYCVDAGVTKLAGREKMIPAL